MDGVRILQIFLILIPIAVIIYLFRLSKSLRLEKRISCFAITSFRDQEVSFFDQMLCYFWIVVRKCSLFLKKSQVLRKYGERYEKYIPFSYRDKKTGIDYVTIKFLFSLFVLILGIITLIIHYNEFDGMVLVLMLLLVFFGPDLYLHIQFNRKRKRVNDDLLKAVIIMNNAFSSDKNIMQAIMMVKTELDGPIKDEFEKIYLDITYGLSLDVVFNRFYERIKLEDAKYIATSLTLLNRTGGNIVEVFSRLEKTILDKKNLEQELYSLTASSRFVFRFLVFLPFVFVLLIFFLNPSYFTPLISSGLGIIILVIIIILYVFYIYLIKKMLEVRQ